jgi:hypothetical protein
MPPPPGADQENYDDEHSVYNPSVGEGENKEDKDEEDDEEPRLKYTRLTKSLAGVYRNGDAVSTSVVFGDRMVRNYFITTILTYNRIPGS